jgi:hypothetical protein
MWGTSVSTAGKQNEARCSERTSGLIRGQIQSALVLSPKDADQFTANTEPPNTPLLRYPATAYGGPTHDPKTKQLPEVQDSCKIQFHVMLPQDTPA